MNGNNHPHLKPTGEPDAVKVARPCLRADTHRQAVRGGVVGKVLRDSNSLATYSTLVPAW
jgi:hypothetical protein